MCASGKISGAVKFGRDWAIPADAERPKDNRIVSGEYKGYRNYKKTLKETDSVQA